MRVPFLYNLQESSYVGNVGEARVYSRRACRMKRVRIYNISTLN